MTPSSAEGMFPLPRRVLRLLFGLLLGLVAVQPAIAVGVLRGTISDVESGEPLPFASVVIKENSWGTPAREDGTFAIRGLPAGAYTVLVSFIGYESQERTVEVVEGVATIVNVDLSPSLTSVAEVQVFGDRALVDVKETSSLKTLSSQDIEDLTIEPTLDALLAQQSGVTVQDGQIHIRGGRADETAVIVDGIALKDAVSGAAVSSALSAGSAAEVSVAKGGWSAKYGDAISGVVDVRVREGTSRFRGHLRYTTDSMVGSESLHYGNIQLEGPNPLFAPLSRLMGLETDAPTFHLDLSTELSDTYLPSIRDLGPDSRTLQTNYTGRLFGSSFTYGDFFRPRGDNSWRMTAKTGWTVHPAHKLTATYIKSLGFAGQFQAVDIGEINRNVSNYPWAWSRRLDNHYTIINDFYSLSLQWKHSLADNMYHQLRLKHRFSSTHQDVAGRTWADYEQPTDDDLDDDHPFFIETGTAGQYHDRYSELAGVDWDFVREGEHHDIEFGLSAGYEDVQYFSLNAYSVTDENPLGNEFDLFHVFPTKANFYLDDYIEYPGIVLRVGVRGDVFFPGALVERLYEDADQPGFTEVTRAEWDANTYSAFGRRYKFRLSPRLAVSHPITDRSHFFFNYGRFTKWPTYFFMYAGTGGVSSPEFPRIGNPDLEPQVSAQYEFGAGHRITDRLSFKLNVFFKDQYDYPTSIPIELRDRDTRRSTFFVYRNADYARTRGVEIELQRRRKKHTWYSASYSFSEATGKSSDPNSLNVVQALGGDARETDLEEQFLWWHRPHKFTLSGGYQVDESQRAPSLLGWTLPKNWKMSFFWLLQSGEAYTPTTPFGTRIDKQFSRSGPVDTVFDVDFSKTIKIGGRSFALTMNARNLFNHRTVLELDSATGETPRPGLGRNNQDTDNPQTLIENELAVAEGNASAASFVSENDAVIRSLTSMANPSYVAAPRSIRLGLSYDW